MAISKEQFQQILSKSQKLCTPEAERVINEKVNKNNGAYDPDPASFDSFDDSMFLAETYNGGQRQESARQINPIAASNSKLPDFIKKSMLEENIDVSSMDPNRSVLDSIDLPKKKQVSETAAYGPQPQQAQQTFDYNIIKAIFEECIDRKLAEFKKQNLNESTLSTIGLRSGKIQLIDNKGKLFTANLEYKGNINEGK